MRFLIYFTIATILLVLILVAMWRVKLEQHKKSLEEKTKTSLIINIDKAVHFEAYPV